MDGDSQVVRIRMTLRNIGHSPAQSALVSTELYCSRRYVGSSSVATVARQRSVCNEAPAAGTQFLTLFPEQRNEQPLSFLVDPSTARGPDFSVFVMLIGCVRYLDSNATAHRTYFAYDLLQANKDGTPDTTGGNAIRLGKTKQVTLKAAPEADLFFAD
jgi:hypothetical protein